MVEALHQNGKMYMIEAVFEKLGVLRSSFGDTSKIKYIAAEAPHTGGDCAVFGISPSKRMAAGSTMTVVMISLRSGFLAMQLRLSLTPRRH